MPKPLELRQRAGELYREAQALYAASKDSPEGMSDEAARRYDSLLDQVETLTTQAGEIEAREARLNALESRMQTREPGRQNDGLLPHQDLGNTRNGYHGYSVLKAMRESMLQRLGEGRVTGLEAEVHTELDQARFSLTGRRAKGVLIPWDLPIDLRLAAQYRGRAAPPGFEGGQQSELRALTTTTGVGAIPTILSPDLIAILRSRLVVANMGATIMNDMQGLFAIPRQSSAATGSWVTEGTAPTGSNQQIDQVTFAPHTAAAFTDYTRRFLEQSAVAPENFVREDLMAIIARTLELAALNGGTANSPVGIMANTTISGNATAIGTTGGNPTWSTIVSMETAVAVANADIGSLGYVTNAAVRGYLKQAPKIGTTFPTFIWDTQTPGSPLNGYAVGVTNLIPSNLTKSTGTNLSAIIFGNFSDLVIVMWSGLDLLVDPYTGSSSGTVRVVALQDCDVNVRHPESFNICIDAKTV